MRMHAPGMEARPRIEPDLSNMSEVSDFYAGYGPNASFQHGFFVAMDRMLVSPHTVFAPDAREEIQAHLASDEPTILAMTHHTWFDPSNDSAALEQEREVFEPMIGKIVIPARQDYFDMPLIGSIIAIGGAKPIARKKDLAAYYVGQGFADEEIAAKLSGNGEARKEANGLIQGLMVRMAKAGFVYASYVEGTRNRGDQSQLQPVRGGIQNLLEAMDEPEAAKIICLGHDYGGARILKKRYLTPTVYIDAVDAPSDPEETEELLTKTLQGCLDGAIENRYAGAPLSTLAKAATLAAVAGGAILADRLMSRDAR